MVQRSTLFLRNITAIDHAYLDTITGTPKGGSLQLNVLVSGKVDSHEAVVVDFSKIKKSIKALVDGQNHGFDHKLWIPANYETYFPQIEVYEEDGEIEITTPNFSTICPTNAVRFVDLSDIAGSIQRYLETELNVIYPNVGIRIKVELNEDMWIPRSMSKCAMPFRYVHGLKNSSSWGCQNLNHGHLSWLSICDKAGNGLFIPTKFYAKLKSELENAYFVWNENLLGSKAKMLRIGYKCERGYFECAYNQDANIIVIDTDTTVENLAQWFVTQYRDDLTTGEMKEAGAHSVYLSEGLTKGSYQEI